MQLEDYFNFEKFETPHGPVERIRIKGHRISIEHVIEFHNQGVSAEEIVKVHYPTLTLEEVYATLAYYCTTRKPWTLTLSKGKRSRMPITRIGCATINHRPSRKSCEVCAPMPLRDQGRLVRSYRLHPLLGADNGRSDG